MYRFTTTFDTYQHFSSKIVSRFNNENFHISVMKEYCSYCDGEIYRRATQSFLLWCKGLWCSEYISASVIFFRPVSPGLATHTCEWSLLRNNVPVFDNWFSPFCSVLYWTHSLYSLHLFLALAAYICFRIPQFSTSLAITRNHVQGLSTSQLGSISVLFFIF